MCILQRCNPRFVILLRVYPDHASLTHGAIDTRQRVSDLQLSLGAGIVHTGLASLATGGACSQMCIIQSCKNIIFSVVAPNACPGVLFASNHRLTDVCCRAGRPVMSFCCGSQCLFWCLSHSRQSTQCSRKAKKKVKGYVASSSHYYIRSIYHG